MMTRSLIILIMQTKTRLPFVVIRKISYAGHEDKNKSHVSILDINMQVQIDLLFILENGGDQYI